MSIFIVLLFQSIAFAASSTQVLLIDSSFPPVKDKQFIFSHESCLQLAEDNSEVPERGECFSSSTWEQLKLQNSILIEGMQDFLAGIKSTQADAYSKFQIEKADMAKRLRNDYILSVHGTRAASVVAKYSDYSAEIIPVRVVTAQAGTTQQTGSVRKSTFERYGNGCQLRKWDQTAKKEFERGSLQPYQQRIQKALDASADLRVISLSLGYKKSWIAEDNASCKTEFIETEYQVLKKSWQNLLRKNKNRLFIVAAGNEGADFDQIQYKNDDLWAELSDEENLLLVGSLQINGDKYKTSNFGKIVVMTKGEQIDALSPLPGSEMKSHKTTLRGTSFSAPIITGVAIRILKAEPKIEIAKLKEKIRIAAGSIQ